jgi:hypothetical protein
MRGRGGGLLEPPWSRGSDRHGVEREGVTTTAMEKKRCAMEVVERCKMKNESIGGIDAVLFFLL